jgi:hypothetical protein
LFFDIHHRAGRQGVVIGHDLKEASCVLSPSGSVLYTFLNKLFSFIVQRNATIVEGREKEKINK